MSLNTVVIAEDIDNVNSWAEHETIDILEFCKSHFSTWPNSARIYHEVVSEQTDVTPFDKQGVERLSQMTGRFFIVVYPENPVALIVVAIAAAAAVAYLLIPKVPQQAQRNDNITSANNELSERANSQRINGRIPDIFGQVRSTPDLIAVPYTVFENHIEQEIAYMCVGKGEYEVSDIRDDTTHISDIEGASVEVYGPYNSPNGGNPFMRIGTPIGGEVKTVKRITAVNGQTLGSPNQDAIRIIGNGETNGARFQGVGMTKNVSSDPALDSLQVGDSVQLSWAQRTGYLSATGINITRYVTCIWPNIIEAAPGYSFPSIPAGTKIQMTGAVFEKPSGDDRYYYNLDGVYDVTSATSNRIYLNNPGATNWYWGSFVNQFFEGTPQSEVNIIANAESRTVNLDGIYTIHSISASHVEFVNPHAINSDWNYVSQFTGGATPYGNAMLQIAQNKEVGYFLVDQKEANELVLNFVATSGMYKDDGKAQYRTDVYIRVAVIPCNAAGNPIGAEWYIDTVVIGSALTKDLRAATLRFGIGGAPAYKIKAWRMTDSDLGYNGTVNDEVKWRDLFVMSPSFKSNFGNVTTVYSKTQATTGALAVKERKLNMMVTRKLPLYVSETGQFTPANHATRNFADILSFVCKDAYIGGRDSAELDIANFYSVNHEVGTYFGTWDVCNFDYTFDSIDMSFEETVSAIASAVFTTAYRQGSKIKLVFEKETLFSHLLFNHRNKVPGTETRTVNFGITGENDGIIYEYVSPETETVDVIELPSDGSARNPKKIQSVGIRSKLKAHFHAWRAWQKMRLQHTTVEVETTQEAAFLVNTNRILIADNTRSETIDGEIEYQDGLIVGLSQELKANDIENYSFFVQHTDGQVQSINIASKINNKTITLAAAPRLPLATDDTLFTRAGYWIVKKSDKNPQSFILSEKETSDNFTYKIVAFNYDDRYYTKDRDYVNGIVDANGNYL